MHTLLHTYGIAACCRFALEMLKTGKQSRLGAGIMVCAESVAEAFDAMYYLEQAARVTGKALSTGQKLKIVDDKVLSLITHSIVLVRGAYKALV